MRKTLLFGLLAASLGLASCGVQGSLDQAVASLGSSPDVQIHLSATASGSGANVANVEKALSAISVDMRYTNPSGDPLSQSRGTANAEMIVNAGSQPLVDLRVVDANLYVLINVSALTNLPGVSLSTSELSAFQLLFGGRWFELPKSLLQKYLPSSAQADAASIKVQALEQKILDDLSGVIAATPYTSLANGGYAQTGTLESIEKAVLPTINALRATKVPLITVKGTYTLSVSTSGSMATGASVTITAPNGSAGNASVGLKATIAHANDAVVAPTGATVITPSLIAGLLAQSGLSSIPVVNVPSSPLITGTPS